MPAHPMPDADLPPYTNRGVYPPSVLDADGRPITVFDAYNATVYEEPPYLINTLRAALEEFGEQVALEDGSATRWYSDHEKLVDRHGKRLVSIHYGGMNGKPLVQCTGHCSPAVAAALRAEFDHRPNRLDGCVDLAGPDLFRNLTRLTRRIARKYGLRWAPIGDWVTPNAGRTIELGSRKSQVMLRIYEKGKEQATKLGLELTPEMALHVRCEVEFKPQNPIAKKQARIIAPEALWGLTEWLADFTKQAFAMDVERVKVTYRREADYERALRFMGQQYSAHLERLLSDCGGDLDAFAVRILELAQLMPSKAA